MNELNFVEWLGGRMGEVVVNRQRILKETKSCPLGGKKMKKLLAIILAAILCLGLMAGCGQTTIIVQDGDSGNDATPTPEVTEPADFDTFWADTLATSRAVAGEPSFEA